MGHQIHSTGLRQLKNKRWNSKWSVSLNNKTQYQVLLHQDLQIREFLVQLFNKHQINIGVPIIKRSLNNIYLFIPINADLKAQNTLKTKISFDVTLAKLKDTINNYLEEFTGSKVTIFLTPINNAIYNAKLLADFIANELKKRRPYLPVIQNIFKKITSKQGSEKLKSSISGVKIHLSGRLNGVDRARLVKMSVGQLPLNTLDAEIDFAKSTAYTKFGTIGVKVWIAFKS